MIDESVPSASDAPTEAVSPVSDAQPAGESEQSHQSISRALGVQSADSGLKIDQAGKTNFKAPAGPEVPPAVPGATSPKGEPPAAGDVPPSPEKTFKFAGDWFKDQAAAEHAYRTVKGMFKEPLGQVKTVTAERDTAVERANQWHQRATQLEQQLAELKAAQKDGPKAGSAPASATPAAGAEGSDGIDWSVAKTLWEHPEVGPMGTLAHYVTEATRIAEARAAKQLEAAEKRLMEQFSPVLSERADLEAAGKVKTLVESMATFVYPADHPTRANQIAYPELADEKTFVRVIQNWRARGGSAEALLTQDGVEQAVAVYRLYYGEMPSAAPKPAATPTADAPRSPSSADTALAMAGSPPPAVRPQAGPADPRAVAKLAIRQAGTSTDLGRALGVVG